MRKARLVGPAGATVHPSRASLAFCVAPWGVQQICVACFGRVPTAGAWTCRLPITPNTTVLHCGVFGAASIGGCTIAAHAQLGTEAVVRQVVPLEGDLRLLFVTAQPMSYKRLYMEWLPFGTPRTACNVTCALDFSELPDSFETHVTLRQGPRGRPLEIHGKTVAPVVMRHCDNARLTVRVQHPKGFHVPRPVFAPDDNGQYVVLHGDKDDAGTTWYIKGGPKDAEGDNLMSARTSPEVPPDVAPASNSELLQCVAGSIMDKSRGRRSSRRISISNVHSLLGTVETDPLCWSVTAPRTACGHHPYVEDLARLARYLAAVGMRMEELEVYADSVSASSCDDDDGVRSVLRAVFDD